jgi:DNA-binding transcriptional regulator GbsR (MarR family)
MGLIGLTGTGWLWLITMHAFEKEFIDFSTDVWKGFGIGSLSSRLFAILYLEPQEISIRDLSTKTGYSLASISIKMRLLEGLGWVHRIKKPGTKEVFYYMEKNFIKVMAAKFERIRQNEIMPAKKVIPALLSKYKDAKLDAQQKKKMKVIKDYYSQIRKLEVALGNFEQVLERL